MGTIIVVCILVVSVGCVIHQLVRDRKKGKSCGCGDCNGCGMKCGKGEKENSVKEE